MTRWLIAKRLRNGDWEDFAIAPATSGEEAIQTIRRYTGKKCKMKARRYKVTKR
jgi:hypothetical protein